MCHLKNVTGRGSTLVCADYWTTTAASLLFTRPIIIGFSVSRNAPI